MKRAAMSEKISKQIPKKTV